MPEEEPVMKLGLDGEEFLATRDNSHLFTHMGRLGLSMYDHIFLVRGEDEGTMTGTYLFNRIHLPDEVFTQLGEFMVNNGYHADLNRPSVPDCDVRAYDATIEHQAQDLGDFLPEGWE